MPTIIKPEELVFQHDPNALPAFDLLPLSPRMSKIVGSKHMVFDIRKLEPDTFSFPYHFHHHAEELIMILSGSMTLRTEKGFEIIRQGQMVFFEIGATGVHQFYNHEKEACIYLDIRTTQGFDMAEYPDSGKINISSSQVYEKKSIVDYNKGEENVREIWKNVHPELH